MLLWGKNWQKKIPLNKMIKVNITTDMKLHLFGV